MNKFLQKIRDKFTKNDYTDVNEAVSVDKKVYYEYLDKSKKIFNDNGYNIFIHNNSVCIENNDLKIIGKSVNTFWTAEGVLCKKEYDFDFKENVVMIDIGLNIGITTLFMAQKKNIVQIYGFEPFEETFKQAQENLEKNPHLSEKVKIFNFGLGNKNEMITMNYNPDRPGAMSSVVNRFEECSKIEKIEIKKSSNVFIDIIKNHPNKKIFLKMDCEGAEKEILEDLDSSEILKSVDIILMEWHFHNPSGLIEILNSNGYIVFNDELDKNKLGFIRAVKMNNNI